MMVLIRLWVGDIVIMTDPKHNQSAKENCINGVSFFFSRLAVFAIRITIRMQDYTKNICFFYLCPNNLTARSDRQEEKRENGRQRGEIYTYSIYT